MITGTSAVRTAVIAARTSSPAVMIRLVYASPPSGSDLIARTICGTRTVFRTPPASRMYMLLGTVLAMVNISACRVPLPNRNTSSISRKKPINRDSAVPAAITALAEISRLDAPAARVPAPSEFTSAPEARRGPGRPGSTGSGSPAGSRPDWVVVSAIASIRGRRRDRQRRWSGASPGQLDDLRRVRRRGRAEGGRRGRGENRRRLVPRRDRGRPSPLSGHGPDPQRGAADQHQPRAEGDHPTCGPVLGDLHLQLGRGAHRTLGHREQLGRH